MCAMWRWTQVLRIGAHMRYWYSCMGVHAWVIFFRFELLLYNCTTLTILTTLHTAALPSTSLAYSRAS